MISLPYAESSFRFKHRYHEPIEPDALLGGMDITITRTDSGEVLVAKTAMTPSVLDAGNLFSVKTAPTLAAGAEQTSYTVISGTDVSTFREGDVLSIYSAARTTPNETFEVRSANQTTDIIYFKRPLLYSHEFGALIVTNTYFYDIDLSTVADWPAGMEVQIVCSPTLGVTNQGLIATYLGTVEKTQFVLSNVSVKFAAIYPHVYSVIEPRFGQVEEAAYKRLKIYFNSKGRDLDRVADQEMIEPALIEQIYLLGATRSDENEFELTMAKETLNEQLLRLEDTDIWFDDNQDKVKDETEIGIEAWYPVGRGI